MRYRNPYAQGVNGHMLMGKRQGASLYVKLEGEIDHNSAQRLRGDLDKLLSDSAVMQLTLDMASVEFMDSSGVGLILGRYKTLQKRGGKLIIKDPRPQIDRVLQLSGVYQIIQKQERGRAAAREVKQ